MKILRVRLRGIAVLGILAALTVIFIYLPSYRNPQLLIPSPAPTITHALVAAPLLEVQATGKAEILAPPPEVQAIEKAEILPPPPEVRAIEKAEVLPPPPEVQVIEKTGILPPPPEQKEVLKPEDSETPIQEGRNESSQTVTQPPSPNPRVDALEKLLQKAELEVEHPLKNDNEQDSYVQDYPDYTPANFVEVKKTKPDTGGLRSQVQQRLKNLARLRSLPREIVDNVSPNSPFSLEALRNRALSFPENSSLRKFLAEQDRRANHVKETCPDIYSLNVDVQNRAMGPPPGLAGMQNLLLDRLNHIAFCPVYKAASTSWTITILEIGGYWNSKNRRNSRLQNLVSQVFPKVSNFAGPALTRSMTRFMVVRHPFERLLSCYRDKFEHARKEYYYTRYGDKMVRMYREFPEHMTSSQIGMLQEQVRAKVKAGVPVRLPGNPFAKPLGPTFPEFVKYIIHNKHDDEHWRTYYDHCSPCHMDYHFILRFEDLYAEGKQLIEYLNRTSQVHMRWENPTQSGSSTSDVICSYYNQLTLEMINELSKKYEKDFMLYEYKPDRYLKCASDFNAVKQLESKKPAD